MIYRIRGPNGFIENSHTTFREYIDAKAHAVTLSAHFDIQIHDHTPANTLDRIRITAQRDADNMKSKLVILNLNRYHPVYVIRKLSDTQIEAAKATGEWIETVEPKEYI